MSCKRTRRPRIGECKFCGHWGKVTPGGFCNKECWLAFYRYEMPKKGTVPTIWRRVNRWRPGNLGWMKKRLIHD